MTFLPLFRSAVLALATLTFSAATWAQAPFSSLKLEFAEPTGTVSSTDSVPIYLKLTNTDRARDFVFDSSLPLAGLNAADVPTSANLYNPSTGLNTSVDFAAYTSFRLDTGYGCNDYLFTIFCTPGIYTASWPSAGTPFVDHFKLAPGQSFEYLFVTLTPTNGSVSTGYFELTSTVLRLEVNGLDAAGNAIWQDTFPVNTCKWIFAEDCALHGESAFTRHVVAAVPEPTTTLMLSLGLASLAALRRRR